MKAKLTNRPVERVIASIESLDLGPIKLKLMNPEEGLGWSREYADRMELAYKRFLTLLVTHPEVTLAPCKDVDKFWHGHILDTLKYAEDCDRMFGCFLHHFPYFGMRGAEDAANLAKAAENTRRLYRQEFGSAQNHDASGSRDPMKGDAAFCGAIGTEDSAFCGAIKAEDAAFCGAIRAGDVAFCGAITAEGVAFCGAIKAEDAAFCGAIRAEDAAFCGALTDEDAARRKTARSISDELNVSVRPILPAAF
jgi:hypothetical protein